MAQNGPPARFRAVAFTWFNYPEDAADRLKALEAQVTRLHAGIETAPTTGRNHIQGHARLRNPAPLSFWTKRFPGIHIERQVASDAANTAYCAKEGNVIVDIGKDEQPKTAVYANRNEEAIAVMDAVDSGETFGQVRKRHRAFCFWHAGLVKAYKKDNEVWGPSGDNGGDSSGVQKVEGGQRD